MGGEIPTFSLPLERGQMEATISSEAIPESDRDLVQRHRYGDAEAFDEIYQRHAEMIYNLAYRLSGDEDQASDLAQEVFFRAFRHLERFRGRSSLKTWLYRVGLNHCRSRLARRRWFFVPVAEGDPTEGLQLVDRRRDPEARAMAGERDQILHRALAKLPLPFREVVVLCDLEGLTYEEIAEVLGVRIGTVRSRIARARGKLRVLLDTMPQEGLP